MSVAKRGKQGPEDANEAAFRVFRESIGEAGAPVSEAKKNPAAVQLGRLGGLKGGRARADSLSSEKRSEIARRAAEARWGKNK